MKSFMLIVLNLLAWFWLLLPAQLRSALLTGLIILESRSSDPAQGLRRLMPVKDRLEWIINERAMAYGSGEHPKHRLTQYHSFFIDRIQDGERILDVGCGYGAVARSIAQALPRSTVVGMDLNEARISQAQASRNPLNLCFVLGDATKEVPLGKWDVVVLSNVLEHIVDRSHFLRDLQLLSQASRILVRIPLFERDWQIPLREELGINYFSDDDHKIEHKLAEFQAEVSVAELDVVELKTLWGEIWADCRPKCDAGDGSR